jgi:chromosome segregation ATPase
MADTGTPSHGTGLEPRVARLEADVAEIKSILNRLAPRIDEMYGFLTAKLPELATKAEAAELRTETKTEIAELRTETRTEIAGVRTELAALRTELKSEIAELRIEIMQRPTRRQTVFDIFSVVELIGVILTIAARFAH